MRIRGLVIAGVLVMTLLAGCTAPQQFGFLDEEQTAEDVLSPADAGRFGVDPATVRYQGEADDVRVFLALADDDIRLVLVSDDPEEWVSGGAEGDTWVSVGGIGGFEATYLPRGLEDLLDGALLEGWVALSDWVIVKP